MSTISKDTRMITIKGAREHLEQIAMLAHDPEYAHIEEDKLHRTVLRAIAGGSPDAVELAGIALQTRNVVFPRWYA